MMSARVCEIYRTLNPHRPGWHDWVYYYWTSTALYSTIDDSWVANPNTSSHSRWIQRYIHLLETNSTDNAAKQVQVRAESDAGRRWTPAELKISPSTQKAEHE